jgi:hypothetical protein
MTIPETPPSNMATEDVVLPARRVGTYRSWRMSDGQNMIELAKEPARYYIQLLRHGIPAEHWFHTQPIAPHEE